MSFIFFFFFKQKTAYEIYQCDWSSDVCSSDLPYNVSQWFNQDIEISERLKYAKQLHDGLLKLASKPKDNNYTVKSFVSESCKDVPPDTRVDLDIDKDQIKRVAKELFDYYQSQKEAVSVPEELPDFISEAKSTGSSLVSCLFDCKANNKTDPWYC